MAGPWVNCSVTRAAQPKWPTDGIQGRDESDGQWPAAVVHAIDHDRMKMHVQREVAGEPLHELRSAWGSQAGRDDAALARRLRTERHVQREHDPVRTDVASRR